MPLDTKPKIQEQDFCSIVVTGMMNPSIHYPGWYRTLQIISAEEERQALANPDFICLQQIAQFSFPNIKVICQPERWEVNTTSSECFSRLVEIADKVFETLFHTPLSLYGFNFSFHRNTGLELVGEHISSLVRPLPLGLDTFPKAENFGGVSLTSRFATNKASVRVEESMHGRCGVFVAMNFEYSTTPLVPPGGGLYKLSEPLRKAFDESRRKADEAVQNIVRAMR